MALFQVDIQKRLGTEFWTNRYFVEQANLATAQVTGADLVTAEVTIHSVLVEFVNFRVRPTAVSDQYVVVPINENGGRNVTDLLPLFNTLRIDIQATQGRPSRKFYRGVLTENDINGSALENVTLFDDFTTLLEGFFTDSESNVGLVDPQGTDFVQATVYQFVQMRQLRRGKRRRANPIFQ